MAVPSVVPPMRTVNRGLPVKSYAGVDVYREMVEFLMTEKKLSREDAYMLCSLAGNLHVPVSARQVGDGPGDLRAMLRRGVQAAQASLEQAQAQYESTVLTEKVRRSGLFLISSTGNFRSPTVSQAGEEH